MGDVSVFSSSLFCAEVADVAVTKLSVLERTASLISTFLYSVSHGEVR